MLDFESQTAPDMQRTQNLKAGIVLLAMSCLLCLAFGQSDADLFDNEMPMSRAIEAFRIVDRLPTPDNPVLRRGVSYRVSRGVHIPYGTLRFAATKLKARSLRDYLELVTYLRDRDGHMRYIAANALMDALGIVIDREDAPLYGMAADMASHSYAKALSVLLDRIASRLGHGRIKEP